MPDNPIICPSCEEENPAGTKTCGFCTLPLISRPGRTFDAGTRIIIDNDDFKPNSTVFIPGSLIANRYEVLRELGRGGMGAVYLVADEKLVRNEVALKIISPALVDSPEMRKRFVQEVLAAQELFHENIIRVHHLDEYRGLQYLTMEYLSGKSLRDVMGERFDQKKTFLLPEAIAIIKPILAALCHAHSRNVIHRDLKPENIIVEGELPDVSIKVLDFGLARIMSPSRLTSTAVAMGTAYYMSPEQLSGRDEVDHRSDLFSVGVILYELLTRSIPSGRFKLPGELISDIPEIIDYIVDKSLATKPGDRFHDAKSFHEAIHKLHYTESLALNEEKRRKEAEERKIKARELKRMPGEEKGKKEADAQARESERQLEHERKEVEEKKKQVVPANEQTRMVQEDTAKKEIFKEENLGMKFVYIEPGSFMMGSPLTESGRYDDERLHRVTFTQGYYMQATPVTQGQWKAVMEYNPSDFSKGGDLCPVERVSWDDAQEFIRRLNEHEKLKRYRLPTEAEWEYAARAGSTKAYHFGNSEIDLDRFAWYEVNSEGRTNPVGRKSPNAWGLYDMHGNVWEWVTDWYGDYPFSAVVDPKGPSPSAYRVIRGGSWDYSASYCRSAFRDWSDPGARSSNRGFRLVRFPGL